ncbi:MAG: tandem-95 repeat protein [Verrucomicrobia bacterium]|nr:tandem-95 repeat protein [Verrucomicrobiota bacterium]
MNGYQSIVVRRITWAMLVAVVLNVSFVLGATTAVAAEKKGRAGTATDGRVVNFSELAERESSQPRRAKSRPVPRKSAPAHLRETNLVSTVAAASAPVVAASDTVLSAASLPASPAPSASFVALLDNAVAFNPDTQGAVGPNHLMVALSSEVRIQTRTGGVISTVSLDGFWGSLGNTNVFDPRVIYDPNHQRWIIGSVSNPATNNSRLLIAISENSDPTGNWTRHGIRVDDVDGVYASSPHIGLSRDWITIQANMLDQTGLFYFSSDIFTFNKTNLYAGGAAAYRRFYHFPAGVPLGVPLDAATPVPMVSFDDSYPTNFLVANVGTLGGLGRLRVFTISGPIDDPIFDEYDQARYVAAGPAFGNPSWDSIAQLNDNLAPQLGTTNRIYMGDARMQSVVFRNGALWAAHHVFLPTNAPNRVSVQWWSFTSGGSVLQHGRMDDPTSAKMYSYPSLAVNRYEDVLIGYTRFAGNQYPSANYAFHGYQDGPGRLQADTVLKAGEAKFTVADNGLVLWGDWSATMVDPLNDSDLWTLQEYASSPVNSIERWGTWWGRVSPPTILGIRVSDSPDPLVAGSLVNYSIQITNLSSHIATGVRITNTLPAGATFIGATVPQGACEHTNGVVVCHLGDLDGDALSNVVVSATIVARLNQAGTATNRVSVFGYSRDEDATDNSALVTTTVSTAADVALTMSATPNPAILSNNVTYLLAVTNRGPSAAGSVVLTNTLPTGISFVSASSSQGSCASSGGTVTCTFGTFSANAGALVTLVGRVNVLGPQTNVARIASLAVDPNSTNDSASIVVRGNTLPLLQAISNRTINEDTSLGPIPFTIGDAETPLESLVLNAFSSNPSIVPPQNIVLSGSGSSRAITVTPLPNANGAITITRTLADLDGSIVSNSFVLTITSINDPPSITDLPNQVVNEDAVIGPLAFAVGDFETAAASLTLSGASSNPVLIPNANIQFGGSGANRTVRLIPTTNQSGTATITITVSDGAVTMNDTFVVTVNAVNDPPSITDIANQSVREDTATSVLSFKISDVETPLTGLIVSATSSNPLLVPVANVVFSGTAASRSVVVTPAANQFGVATVTISVTDANNGVASDSFAVTVVGVNDTPTLGVISAMSIPEDAGPQTVLLSGISGGAPNETNSLSVTVTSSKPSLIPNPPAFTHLSGSTNSFVFTPAADSNGTATLTVTINDGGASNNIITRTFGVTVTAVNDPPTISGLSDQSVNEDGATAALPFVVRDVESAPTLLTVFGASSNTNLVPASNIVFGGSSSNRTIAITPAPDRFGSTTITVFVRDASATNSASFLLTVNPVNDLPSISVVTNRTTSEDVATNITFTVTDKETGQGALVLSASSSNPALISDFTFGGTDSNRFLTVLPVTNQSGSATITLAVTDSDGGSNTTSFVLSVLPVNDLPTIDPIADVTIEEDSGLRSVDLSGISSGAPNEQQPVSVSALTSNLSLLTNVTISFVSETQARVNFVPVRDANGTAQITVRLNDGISTNSRSFAVNILPVNDLPSISTPANLEIDEDATASVPVTISDLETPPAGLTIQVQSSNPEVLDESGVAVEGSGTNRIVRLTPLAEVAGLTVITLTVVDGDNGTAATTFELNVRAVNDAPTISGLAAVTIDEDSVATVLPFVVGDAESFPSSLLVEVASSNPTVLPSGNLVLGGSGSGRTLTFSPSLNEFGTSVVSVIVREGSGPADLSTTNSFAIVVAPLNDSPTLDAISSVVIPAGAGLQSITLSGIGMGAANESQILNVSAVSSDVAIVPNPAVVYTTPASSGSLSFAPVSGATGVVTMTVSVIESGGQIAGGTNRIDRSFTVNVSGPGPALLVERVNGTAVISWSTNSALNWRLESTTNVSLSSSWVVNPISPALVNGRFTVTNAIDGVTRFYRLRNQ